MGDSDKRFPLLVRSVDWAVLDGIDVKNVDHVLSRVSLVNYMIAQDLEVVEVCMKTVGVYRKKVRLSQYYNA